MDSSAAFLVIFKTGDLLLNSSVSTSSTDYLDDVVFNDLDNSTPLLNKVFLNQRTHTCWYTNIPFIQKQKKSQIMRKNKEFEEARSAFFQTLYKINYPELASRFGSQTMWHHSSRGIQIYMRLLKYKEQCNRKNFWYYRKYRVFLQKCNIYLIVFNWLLPLSQK